LRARHRDIPLIIDAGIGTASHAVQALELGFDGVLINSAVAKATDPVKMAVAFAHAVEAGRTAYLSGPIEPRDLATPSTPMAGRAFLE
jgi:thiazole synthase